MALSDRERYTRDVLVIPRGYTQFGAPAHYQLMHWLCCFSNGYGSHILRHWYQYGFSSTGSTLYRWQQRLWWEGQPWL